MCRTTGVFSYPENAPSIDRLELRHAVITCAQLVPAVDLENNLRRMNESLDELLYA